MHGFCVYRFRYPVTSARILKTDPTDVCLDCPNWPITAPIIFPNRCHFEVRQTTTCCPSPFTSCYQIFRIKCYAYSTKFRPNTQLFGKRHHELFA